MKLYTYKLTVHYKKGYFANPKMPLIQTLEYHSIKPKTIEEMQKVYPHCTIVKVKEFEFGIHTPEQTTKAIETLKRLVTIGKVEDASWIHDEADSIHIYTPSDFYLRIWMKSKDYPKFQVDAYSADFEQMNEQTREYNTIEEVAEDFNQFAKAIETPTP